MVRTDRPCFMLNWVAVSFSTSIFWPTIYYCQLCSWSLPKELVTLGNLVFIAPRSLKEVEGGGVVVCLRRRDLSAVPPREEPLAFTQLV